ncbi:MAG: DUF3800 domain-containing protein [Armatimonadota bacterium]|nr:DUF3800 domain-containing protein [Armatimonadota bacterium]
MVSEAVCYCVDEAGDPTIWGRRGKVLIGCEGCSNYLILGSVKIGNLATLSHSLESLRKELLSDPYFKKVPSMQPENRKTAVCFHAKDDLPEVRRDVFSLLLKQDIEFHAVVRCKRKAMQIVTDFLIMNPDYRYNVNQFYDDLVRRLFGDKLHRHGHYDITFAVRGSSNRTQALRQALESARKKYCKAHGIGYSSTFTINAMEPKDHAGLQAVDYLLWSLQRLYEKGEDRFLEMMWPKFHCVWDCDDAREKEGILYNAEKPLTAAILAERPANIGSPE